MRSRYSSIVGELSRLAFELIKDGHSVNRSVLDTQFTVGNRQEDSDIISSDFEFDFIIQTTYTEEQYLVDGGANAGYDNDGEEITPLISIRFEIPKKPDWQEVSFDIKDVIRHELEHLTQDGANVRQGKQMDNDQCLRNLIKVGELPNYLYFKLEKEVDAMLQGLYYKAKKARKPFRQVINTYLDKQPISRDEIDNIISLWKKRAETLNLPAL